MDIVYLDFRKAFDRLPHDVMVGKQEDCGLDSRTVRWLENRKQRVVVHDWREVTSGGAQFWAWF